ncbi:MAG: ABC transporter substrate-binding protein [Myxococcales bacterium]|nr:ABC transporter substrate-binding protein [Myxococcales bacterium]
MSLRTSALMMSLLCLIAVGLTACSLALDFGDECAENSECVSQGEGYVCSQGYCVLPTASGEQCPKLTNEMCATLFGATEAEVCAGDAYLIGALLSKSGALAADGPRIEKAVELAVSEVNQVGGIFGKKVAILSCDDGTDAAVAIPAAEHLINVVGVDAVVGAVASGVSIEVFNSVAKDKGVLMISPSATAPSLTDLPDEGLMWRTAPSDSVQGGAIASHLLSLGQKKVAVINREDAYGNGLSEAIQKVFCGADKDNCSENRFMSRIYGDDSTSSDQSAAIVELKKFLPDIVVLISFFDDGIAFLKLTEGTTMDRFILTDGMRDKTVIGEISGKIANSDALLCKIVGTVPADPSGDAYQAFSLRYKAKWGDSPGAFNAHAYDATYIVMYAIAGLGLEPNELDGKKIAGEIQRLTDGPLIDVGTSDWNGTIQSLRNNKQATVDIRGASGDLDFDLATGEPKSTNIEGWRFDLEKNDVVSFGVMYSSSGEYTAPDTGMITGKCASFFEDVDQE